MDTNLFFDADYTTKAIAIGVIPTRQYVKIRQLQADYLDPTRNIEQNDWKDYRDFESGHNSYNPDQL